MTFFNGYRKPGFYNPTIDALELKIYAEIIRKFMWLPKKLPASNTHYTTNQKKTKWLSWEFIEKRVSEVGYAEYWSNAEAYLKHYHIDTNTSTRSWCNDSYDWVNNAATFMVTHQAPVPVTYIKVGYDIL